MFVVWRTKPIASTRAVELLVEHFDTAECRTRLGGLHLPEGKNDPLVCRHTGADRASLTPLLMHAARVEGKPRQKLLHRFPSVRTCCVKDALFRAAWWCVIDEWAATLEDDRNHTQEEQLFFHRDRKAIFVKLREVVPPAPRSAMEAFTEYRSRKAAKARQEYEAYREQARQQWEEQERQSQASPEEPSPYGPAPWWKVLGVPRTATLDDVKAAYRRLAMQHHPDRSGDSGAFQCVQVAYEQARAVMEGP